MTKINKNSSKGLTKEKKQLLKNTVGKCSTPVDLNKVRDWVKYAKD